MDHPLLRQLRDDALGMGWAARSRHSEELVPRTRTADKVVQSVCPYCAVGCGQRVYVKGKPVVQIEGDSDSPISRGRLCPKGAFSERGGERHRERAVERNLAAGLQPHRLPRPAPPSWDFRSAHTRRRSWPTPPCRSGTRPARRCPSSSPQGPPPAPARQRSPSRRRPMPRRPDVSRSPGPRPSWWPSESWSTV
jgi:hypothetical protein